MMFLFKKTLYDNATTLNLADDAEQYYNEMLNLLDMRTCNCTIDGCKIVKMDIANYVNKVGKLVNQSTKYNAKLDRVSITNLVLLLHLDKLAKWAANNLNDEEFPITQTTT